MAWDEDECLPLSGVQHLAFCARQFALIHVEGLWVENTLTFEGRALHERADDPFSIESRGTVLISRSVPLLSLTLGLYGVADVVEFHLAHAGGILLPGRQGSWQPYPVEYKRGRVKSDDRDAVQLCAQAMCLEEMLSTPVPEGALFYGQTRRRQTLRLDQVLRGRVLALSEEMHRLYDTGSTPAAVWTKACGRCSLSDVCLPKAGRRKNVRRYVQAVLRRWEAEDAEAP